MSLSKRYPELFDRLENEDLEYRHIINIDENYEDIDADEFEFNFEEYNYIIYIAEPLQKVLGNAKMEELMVRLNENINFSNFMATELDLYGIYTLLTEEEIRFTILDIVKEML